MEGYLIDHFTWNDPQTKSTFLFFWYLGDFPGFTDKNQGYISSIFETNFEISVLEIPLSRVLQRFLEGEPRGFHEKTLPPPPPLWLYNSTTAKDNNIPKILEGCEAWSIPY